MRTLTRAEEEVMQFLWKLGKANVAEIIEEMPTPKPAYNTVSTIVRILQDKGFVDYERKGRWHLYFPIVSKEAYTKFTINRLKTNYFDGSIQNMLSFFVKKEKISLENLEEILKEINKNEK